MKKMIRIFAAFLILFTLTGCLTMKFNNRGGNSENARSSAPGQQKK